MNKLSHQLDRFYLSAVGVSSTTTIITSASLSREIDLLAIKKITKSKLKSNLYLYLYLLWAKLALQPLGIAKFIAFQSQSQFFFSNQNLS